MATIRVEKKSDLQEQLDRRVVRLEKGEAVRQFAQQFFSQVPLAELRTKSWDYALAVLLSAWSFYKEFDGKKARVRVFNPTQRTHGYEHSRTIVEVASRSLPFLLDSIRIELAARDIALVDVQQCTLGVLRGSRKQLVIDSDAPANESLIHLEIERLDDLKELQTAISEVIRLVQRVVDDFAPMRQQLLLWSDEVGSSRAADSQAVEAHQYLQWIYANNFTFLGFEEFERAGESWRAVKGSQLGLVRPRFYAAGQSPGPADEIVNFSRSPLKSRVHRPAHFDELTICLPSGKRACRFLGLYTSSVFNQSPTEIPVVRQRIEHVFDYLGLAAGSHKGRQLNRIIEVLPREELFLASTLELTAVVERIYALQERRVVRVMARRDGNCHFVSCLVYVPRDTYDTALRIRIQELLNTRFGALESDFATFFSESALVRAHFLLRVDPQATTNVDVDELESIITGYTRNWEEDLHSVLVNELGKLEGDQLFARIRGVFPPGYQDDYWPVTAYNDLERIFSLNEENPMRVMLYQWMVAGKREIRFKIFHLKDALPLSDVIPILENLGARTIEEHPYEVKVEGQKIWIHDFVLDMPLDPGEESREIRDNFEEAFLAIWNGGQENDAFNRLVTTANMPSRRVWVLRAYARYLGQLGVGNSQQYIADCMRRYKTIAGQFVSLFEIRFNPANHKTRKASDQSNQQTELLAEQILSAIENVENLTDDRILRSFLEMILATQRTNYYQLNTQADSKNYLSLKFMPREISEVPEPKPRYEIFVYASDVEGVHLRGGKIARGGLRWSDRTEDYRTEVLGLVKAQQVKNSVIVPLGAKGGFLPKQIPDGASRDEVMVIGIACYQRFIRGLLDVTDNLVNGKVVPPDQVVRHDEDDYYLVVAADKGTASFSDIANAEAVSYGFWLGDAFASGGSNGYDHKQMGITARGAWRSVERHFLDLGMNPATDEFTTVGIGDMSGDVFGNGMLLSEKLCLVGAFNHLHIFVDPNPDAAASFKERQRLFRLGRSGWNDYQVEKISKGGGVFSRSAKSIPITREMKKRFGIEASELTPNALISYLLKAEVDLLWNGGIGTYVKSRLESHLDARDKANDPIRVNGADLRCRVVGEGGNLGLTQLGRVEFSLAGGRCYTDFIDNAGGVNSSDAEVNIKILLNQLVEQGSLTERARQKLLPSMTDDVAELVLENNYRQARAINLLQYQAFRRNFEYIRVMKGLEEDGDLDVGLEYLPGDEEMQNRLSRHQALTSPELAVLTSYVKGQLKEVLAQSGFSDDYVKREMFTAFPGRLAKRYSDQIVKHRLANEIVATQLANDMVNNMGISFVSRIAETTGASAVQIAHAYVGARDIFSMEARLERLSELEGHLPTDAVKDMQLDLIRLVRRSTRWLLRHRRDRLDLAVEVPLFAGTLKTLLKDWQKIVGGEALDDWQLSFSTLSEMGVEKQLASFFAASHHLYSLLGIVEVANRTGQPAARVAQLLFSVGEHLQLHWFSLQMHEYQAASQWEALARESLQDDLNWQHAEITLAVINEVLGSDAKTGSDPEEMITVWMDQHRDLVQRWLLMQSEIRASATRDLSIFTVAIRELRDLSAANQP